MIEKQPESVRLYDRFFFIRQHFRRKKESETVFMERSERSSRFPGLIINGEITLLPVCKLNTNTITRVTNFFCPNF